MIRPASKSTSSRLRKRRPLVKNTSPSATLVHGLSDQTATVELWTFGWPSNSTTKRLYSLSDFNALAVINRQVGRVRLLPVHALRAASGKNPCVGLEFHRYP